MLPSRKEVTIAEYLHFTSRPEGRAGRMWRRELARCIAVKQYSACRQSLFSIQLITAK